MGFEFEASGPWLSYTLVHMLLINILSAKDSGSTLVVSLSPQHLIQVAHHADTLLRLAVQLLIPHKISGKQHNSHRERIP